MNSEPAFPIVDTTDKSSISPGLTKREWFAGMALQGMISHFGARYTRNDDWHTEQAFKIADEMIAESEKQNH